MSALYAPAEQIWQRVLSRVEVTDGGCWRWTGCVNSRGYGCIGAGKRSKTITVHRLAVIVRDGSIPDGMTIDHTCHDSEICRLDADCPHRRCVNPDHLAVLTIGENTARQWESGLCRKGHPLRTKPSNGKRYCAECEAEKRRKRNGSTSSDYWAMKRGELPRSA